MLFTKCILLALEALLMRTTSWYFCSKDTYWIFILNIPHTFWPWKSLIHFPSSSPPTNLVFYEIHLRKHCSWYRQYGTFLEPKELFKSCARTLRIKSSNFSHTLENSMKSSLHEIKYYFMKKQDFISFGKTHKKSLSAFLSESRDEAFLCQGSNSQTATLCNSWNVAGPNWDVPQV